MRWSLLCLAAALLVAVSVAVTTALPSSVLLWLSERLPANSVLGSTVMTALILKGQVDGYGDLERRFSTGPRQPGMLRRRHSRSLGSSCEVGSSAESAVLAFRSRAS